MGFYFSLGSPAVMALFLSPKGAFCGPFVWQLLGCLLTGAFATDNVIPTTIIVVSSSRCALWGALERERPRVIG